MNVPRSGLTVAALTTIAKLENELESFVPEFLKEYDASGISNG